MEGVSQNTQSAAQPATTPRQPPEVYKFSSEELRVLRQCNVESFYQRSLPLGTLLGLGAYYLVKAGHLKGHVRFGATPKVCVSVIAGYFIGKISYRQKCAEKLMALPNSHIGELLRQRKSQGINENLTLEPGFSTTGVETNVDIAPRQSYLDLDSDRPSYGSEYDKPLQDDASYDVSVIPVPPGGPPTTTYDELRRKNREEYESQQRNKSIRLPEIEESPTIIRAKAPPRSEALPTKPKNKYGDDWEN